jgi:hypothetical protein
MKFQIENMKFNSGMFSVWFYFTNTKQPKVANSMFRAFKTFKLCELNIGAGSWRSFLTTFALLLHTINLIMFGSKHRQMYIEDASGGPLSPLVSWTWLDSDFHSCEQKKDDWLSKGIWTFFRVFYLKTYRASKSIFALYFAELISIFLSTQLCVFNKGRMHTFAKKSTQFCVCERIVNPLRS